MAKILEFDATNTTIGSGSTGFTNVIGSEDWTAARNSVANYNSSGGLVVEAAINVPRIQQDKSLVEGEATNLNTNSNIFTGWSLTNSVITNDSTTDPVGGGTGLLMQANANNSGHTMYKNIAVLDATSYRFSIYVKKQNLTYFQVSSGIAFGSFYTNFNLDNLTIEVSNHVNAGIVDIGNGWIRCSIEVLSTSAGNAQVYPSIIGSALSGRNEANATLLDDGYYIWGGMLEAGQLSTSYIETGGAIATREADVITNTVPAGTAPITMTTWIDGVSDGGQVVTAGATITMLDGTTAVEIDDSEVLPTTTVEVEWIDSLSAAATGNKIYRDDVEIADIANGIQIYQDATAETGTEYKYEVQAYSATDETTQEVLGVNVQYITTA